MLEGGASDEKASKAAEEVATYHRELSSIRNDLAMLRWATGALVALMLVALVGQAAIWMKLGDLSAQIARVAAKLGS